MKIALFLTSIHQMDLERISYEDSIVSEFQSIRWDLERISYENSIVPDFNPSDGFRRGYLMKIALFLTSIHQMDLERISYEDSIVPDFNPSDGFREDIL